MTDNKVVVVVGCPICGNQPEIDATGISIDIVCCVSMSRQKCNYMTVDERKTWSTDRVAYDDKVEAKVFRSIIDEWNTRTNIWGGGGNGNATTTSDNDSLH